MLYLNGREHYNPEDSFVCFFESSRHFRAFKSGDFKEGDRIKWRIKNSKKFDSPILLAFYLPASYGKITWSLQDNPNVLSWGRHIGHDEKLNQFEKIFLTLIPKENYEFSLVSKLKI